MPECTPIKAIDVRNAIEAILGSNKLGENLLGTYQYPSGYEMSAIAVGNTPNSVTVQGLEVFIPLVGDTVRSTWTGAYKHLEQEWNIILIQRDTEGSPTLPFGVDRLQRYFWRSRGVYTPQDDILGSYPQYRFTFDYLDLYPTIRNFN